MGVSNREFIRALNAKAAAGGHGVDLGQMTEDEIRERLLGSSASGTEAGTVETEGLDPKDDGPTGNAGDAQTDAQTGGSNG